MKNISIGEQIPNRY